MTQPVISSHLNDFALLPLWFYDILRLAASQASVIQVVWIQCIQKGRGGEFDKLMSNSIILYLNENNVFLKLPPFEPCNEHS